jgi:hypothetical protein
MKVLENILRKIVKEKAEDGRLKDKGKGERRGDLEFLTPDSPVVFSSGPRIGA